MIIEVTCPCGCGHTFEVDVKMKREFSPEDRARRAELMRQMRLSGIGGRSKGDKDTKPRKERSDKGKPRKREVNDEP